MYGVKYKVPFKTLSGRDSVVTLEERGYAGSVIELIAGGTPFIINTDQSDLLAPIRSSTATLAVIGSDYLQDLYANDPQGIRVKCEVDGAVKWLGYLLPDTFSQDFSSPEFEYEMECVAALSTLKYRKFDLTDDFVTFRQIIEKAVEYSGYEVIYLTNSVRTETGKFYDLKISSSNFFDELGEASTYYEALEEIAKYLGCCFVPFEDDLYLLDYAAIRKGFNSYTKIEGSNVSNVTLSDAKVVDNYKGTGAKISRIAGKNKATVNCSLYEIKEILPPFNDEQSEFVRMKDDFTQTIREGKKDVVYRGIIRYFTQPRYTFWRYPFIDGADGVQTHSPIPLNEAGSSFVKTASFKSDSIPSKLNFTNEIQVKMYVDRDSALLGKHLTTASPIFRVTSDKKVFSHPDVWFCISLQLKYNTEEWVYREDSSTGTIDTYTNSQRAQFRIGEWYYNGSGWVNTPATFWMPVKREKGETSYGTYFGLENTNTYDKGLGDMQGFTFKSPDFTVIGECELTLYAFENFPVSPLRTFGMHYFYYKDIEVSYGIPNEQSIYGDWVDKDTKNDIIYENVIGGDYIEEAEEIDLKICTNTDGKLALSSVIEGDSFLKTLTSDVYGTDLPEYLLLDRVVDMFKKPRFVIDPTLEDNAKPYTLFTEPHLGKTFLLAGGEIDVKRESATYNLIEL
jgi:hypothetical protein